MKALLAGGSHGDVLDAVKRKRRRSAGAAAAAEGNGIRKKKSKRVKAEGAAVAELVDLTVKVRQGQSQLCFGCIRAA